MNRAKFFETVRHTLFNGKLSVEQVEGMEAMLSAFEAAKWPRSHASYGLATGKHETAHTMQPIRELGSNKYLDKYDTGKLAAALGNTPEDDDDGILYAGRGYVQLTGRANYEKAQKALGHPFLAEPDLALRPDLAAAIMVRGMSEGWFTRWKNRDFLDKTPPDYRNARRIINGLDDAELIAGYARKFAVALQAAGYSLIPQDSTGTEVVSATITLASGTAKIRTEPEAPQPYRNDGKHETPASERAWWSRVVNKLLGKEP